MRFLLVVRRMAWAAGPVLLAQGPAAPLPAEAAANPVVWSAKLLYARDAKNMIAAAEQMPGDKNNDHPTPDQWTFGKPVSHIAQSNEGCAGRWPGHGAGGAAREHIAPRRPIWLRR